MEYNIKRIALIGPESTGKTTLSGQLSTHYKTNFVAEFAREYVLQLNRPYTPEDILHCAKEQLREEEDAISKSIRFLFCDTELIIAKVWCEDVFKSVPQWIEENIQKRKYDLFLLTSPDLLFENDAVRENPYRRDFFFDWYKRELENYNFSYEIVGGIGDARLQSAIHAIEKYFPSTSI
jgi:NadR type nicotinamide-nucleotide adenylyltransferase